jgi:hypothetical protein
VKREREQGIGKREKGGREWGKELMTQKRIQEGMP